MEGWLGQFTNQCQDPSCSNLIVCRNHNSNPLKCTFRSQSIPTTPNDVCISQAKLSSDPYYFSFVNLVVYHSPKGHCYTQKDQLHRGYSSPNNSQCSFSWNSFPLMDSPNLRSFSSNFSKNFMLCLTHLFSKYNTHQDKYTSLDQSLFTSSRSSKLAITYLVSNEEDVIHPS